MEGFELRTTGNRKHAYKSANDLEASNLFPLPSTVEKSDYISPAFSDSYYFPYNPDSLVNGNDYGTYDEMRDDDQVKVAISIKKDFVINNGWQIVCDDEEIKEYVQKNLENLHEGEGLESTLDDILRDILSSYEYGFSIAEPVFEIKDDLYLISKIKVRPPHTFQFKIDRHGNVLSVTQSGFSGDISLKPQEILHHCYQQDFGNPYGKSDLRAAHTAWKSKKFIVRMYNIYLERFATPTVVGQFPDSLNQADITRFHAMLKTIQNSTALAIPDNHKVDFVQNQRDASGTYTQALDWCNLMIARSILVPDLLGIGGAKTQGGSYSLGKEHFNLFMGTIKKDRQSLAKKITQRLIAPLVAANWGKDIDCKFEFKEPSEENELENLKVWADAVKSRIYKPNPEEVEHFREGVGFPKGPVEILDEPQILPGQFPGQFPKEEPKKEPKPEPKQKPGEEPEMEVKSFKFFREPNQYERKVDFTDIRDVLDSSEESMRPSLVSAAKKISASLIDQIRDRNIISNFKPERINEIEPKFMKEMNFVLKSSFTVLFKDSLEEARRELFPNGTKKFSDSELLPEEFLKILEAEAFKMVGDYTTGVTKKAKNHLVKGMKDGLAQSEIFKLIRDDMDAETDRWISATIRTKTTEIYNNARKTYWETDPLAKQIVEAYEFSAVLDDRTSAVCESLDGEIFEKGEFINRITPPLHVNCRSLLVPITKFEDYEASKEPSLESLREKGGHLIEGGLK